MTPLPSNPTANRARARRLVQALLGSLLLGVVPGCGRGPAPLAAADAVPAAPSGPTEGAASAPEPEPAPVTVGSVMEAARREGSSADLDRWCRDPDLSVELRTVALRGLEVRDPERSVASAIEIARDERALSNPLLGPNAVGVLARSADPRAAEVVAGLEDPYRRLAAALTRDAAERAPPAEPAAASGALR